MNGDSTAIDHWLLYNALSCTSRASLTAMLYCGQHSLHFLRHLAKNDRFAVCVSPRDGGARLGRDTQLRVGRDSELYRILNMHYNKSNVYQVRWLHQCIACFTHCIFKLLSGEGWIFTLLSFLKDNTSKNSAEWKHKCFKVKCTLCPCGMDTQYASQPSLWTA